MKALRGKVGIVTGAARGLGAAFALAMGQQGARVVIADTRDVTRTSARLKDYGVEAIALQADVTDARAVKEMVATAESRFGSVDILVNNAALSGDIKGRPLTEIDSDEWDRVMSVNVRGVFECMKAVVPVMRAKGGGSIVNLSSATTIKGMSGILHYVASKGAVTAMTRAAARELGAYNIRVNAIAPGLIMTEGVLAQPIFKGEALATNISSRCLAREALPEDVVGAMIFLGSDQSGFITGQTLVVDGGSVML
ncbi:glucose 1-dehydrogenase [Bradyrhizobium sp. CW7]|uniref:SDR family NAD(P)-dependent oxidoreductase n=1 Tax=Bradyrhizobium sp. CW7 TaxID=2782688 RepID=UPI001FFAA21B|nr:glucose 1-dehydrogenase [Bradyrhizobium sp. CW7]